MSKSSAYRNKKTGKSKKRDNSTLLLIMVGVVALIVGVALVALFSGGSGTQYAEIGGAAPHFTLTSLDGETINLDDYSGKPVILNFWATWCPPCLQELPELAAFSAHYEGQVAVIGISSEDRATVLPFADSVGIPYPIVIDSAATVNDAYLIRSLPTSVIIDADGVVRQIISGAVTEARLIAEVERLLSAQDAVIAGR